MALLLTTEFPSGLVCDYYKVREVRLNFLHGVAEIHVSLYKDQAARNAGKDPAQTYAQYNFGGSDFDVFLAASQDTAGENPQKSAYALLKTLPGFAGAVDV